MFRELGLETVRLGVHFLSGAAPLYPRAEGKSWVKGGKGGGGTEQPEYLKAWI